MTTVLLDDPQVMSSVNIPSRILGSERNIVRIGQKGKGLRTDSPTTMKACRDLGFLISDLKQKSLDDFREPNVGEEIIQIRFQHYMKKYNQMIKDILNRRKQIAQKIRDDNLLQQQQQQLQPQLSQENSSQRVPKDLMASLSPVFRTRSTGNSPKDFKTPFSSLIPSMNNKGKQNFNKTLSCFINSYEQIDTDGIDNTLSPNDSQMSPNNPFAKLNKTLSQEIFKFNKSKVRQQKNARMRYEDELKRLEMLEVMKEKDKRKEGVEKIKNLARKKSENERQKLQEERAHRMKQLERNYRIQKEEEKKIMAIKFHDARKNFESHVEERNREIAERRQQEDQKNFQALKRRQKFSQEELERSKNLATEISRRLFSKNQTQRANVTEVSMRATIELNKVHERVTQSKERLIQEEEEGMHKMIEKLQKDEDRIRKWNFEYNQSVKNKEAEQKSKHQVFLTNQKDLDSQLKQKLKSIDDKFLRNQKNIEKKKELEEKDRKLKQEIRRLKTEDKKEMQVRLERQLENQRSIILNKEKMDQERLFWIATQKQLIQQAQINTAIQTKLEHDRMNDSVDRLTRTLYTTNSTQGINKYQNRLLRDLYNSEEPMRFREQQLTQLENE